MSNSLAYFEAGEIIEGHRSFVQRFPELVDLAQIETNDAESWRNFDVGVVGAGILPGETDLLIVQGACYKHNHQNDDEDAEDPELSDLPNLHDVFGIPRESQKNCGEVNAVLAAEEIHHYEPLHFVGIIVSGTTDTQEIYDVNKVISKTLVPCADCTEVLDKADATSRSTHYVSTGYSSRDIFEIRTINRLKELHRTKTDGLFHSLPPRLSDDIGVRALEIFDSSIANVNFLGRHPSRVISSLARAALINAGRESL